MSYNRVYSFLCMWYYGNCLARSLKAAVGRAVPDCTPVIRDTQEREAYRDERAFAARCAIACRGGSPLLSPYPLLSPLLVSPCLLSLAHSVRACTCRLRTVVLDLRNTRPFRLVALRLFFLPSWPLPPQLTAADARLVDSLGVFSRMSWRLTLYD